MRVFFILSPQIAAFLLIFISTSTLVAEPLPNKEPLPNNEPMLTETVLELEAQVQLESRDIVSMAVQPGNSHNNNLFVVTQSGIIYEIHDYSWYEATQGLAGLRPACSGGFYRLRG